MTARALPEQNPEVSIVIPVYACASFIDPLLKRTRDVIRHEGWRAEWVFVDDASPDESWRILKEQASKDSRIRGLRLARNCGQHFAIYAGLKEAKGRFSVVMDCDLEDPPEEIPRLMEGARQGCDIVIATYTDRAHPVWRRLASRVYFWMLRGNAADEGRLSTFSVLTEWARSAYVAAPLAGRAYLLVLLGLGLPTAFVASHKEHRPGGGSSYGLGRLSPLAVRNILLFNPWRLACMLSAIALGMLLVAVALWGVRPAVLIWLVGCMLIGGSLAAWRWYMLVWGRPSPQRCETEMLYD